MSTPRFRSSVPWHRRSLWPQGAVPQALTLFGGVRLISWSLRRPSFGECRRGPWYIGKCWAWVGCGPVPGPTLKRPCAILVLSVGRKIDTADSTLSGRIVATPWTLSFLLTNYCLTRFTCILFLLLEYIYVFQATFLCSSCLSFASIATIMAMRLCLIRNWVYVHVHQCISMLANVCWHVFYLPIWEALNTARYY